MRDKERRGKGKKEAEYAGDRGSPPETSAATTEERENGENLRERKRKQL